MENPINNHAVEAALQDDARRRQVEAKLNNQKNILLALYAKACKGMMFEAIAHSMLKFVAALTVRTLLKHDPGKIADVTGALVRTLVTEVAEYEKLYNPNTKAAANESVVAAPTGEDTSVLLVTP